MEKSTLSGRIKPRLNAGCLTIAERKKRDGMPVKIVCFGEGNFIRAFVGYMVERMNRFRGFNGAFVTVQGLEKGRADEINAADGLYEIMMRGGTCSKPLEKLMLVKSLKGCVDPYKNYGELLSLAGGRELKAVFSNTTEFGIAYSREDFGAVHRNFPNKLTRFLFERFSVFSGSEDSTLDVIPLELIENNGKKLKETVLRVAREWNLSGSFIKWLESCRFYDTLVDRIVSGYVPEADLCGETRFDDRLLDVCEPFFLFVLEGDEGIGQRLPFVSLGREVIANGNLKFYRDRKVRILNGAHTALFALCLLDGAETVEQAVCDEVYNKFLRAALFKEIIPAFGAAGAENYAEDVIKRFYNPFLNHRFESIALNSVSKFVVRVLVSVKDYVERFSSAPPLLSMSLAAMIVFYERGSRVSDSPDVINAFAAAFCKVDTWQKINAVLALSELWGQDLNRMPGLGRLTLEAYELIVSIGARKAAEEFTERYYG